MPNRADGLSRLLLVRHGETTWNREQRWQGQADAPLSPLGHEQARDLAERLRRIVPEAAAIYSSDLARARDTAAPAAAALGLRTAEHPGLREMDVGGWSGLSREDIRERFAADWSRIADGEDLPRGGGETLAAFAGRVLGTLRELVLRHRREPIVVVTHGGVIRVVVVHVLGLDFAELRRIPPVANVELIEVDTASEPWRMAAEHPLSPALLR
jgi:broad specificity phosphatase PhoE